MSNHAYLKRHSNRQQALERPDALPEKMLPLTVDEAELMMEALLHYYHSLLLMHIRYVETINKIDNAKPIEYVRELIDQTDSDYRSAAHAVFDQLLLIGRMFRSENLLERVLDDYATKRDDSTGATGGA